MMEVLIGLLVSSLVIGMVYFIYSNLSGQIFTYINQQDEIMEYNQFQNLWHTDVRLSKQLTVDSPKQVSLTMPLQDVTYIFENEYILRKAQRLDTFNIKTSKVEISKDEQSSPSYYTIKLFTTLLEQEVTIFEEKRVHLADQINDQFIIE